MKLFIKSCHASLEYDQARMFMDMGYQVYGAWDIGSKQRKKIPGVTDVNSNIDDFPNIILHQTADFDKDMETLLKQGKKVILSVFGQGCDRQHEHVSKLCASYPKAFISSYSLKDYNTYIRLGCPADKINMIRFSKYHTDFKPWKGKWPVCYISCNSIHRRGDGCGWEILQQVENSGVPVILGGCETAEACDYSIGETEETAMRNIYCNAMCHLHLGTAPAPITLTLLEAFCAGTPVVPYLNGYGLNDERFDLDFCGDVRGLVDTIKRILTDEPYRIEQHKKSVRNAKHFDVNVVAPKWRTLIERLR
jgi:hypothetical protein